MSNGPAIASQMVDARGQIITITIEADGAVFQVSGKTIDFPGFLRAYVEGSDDPEAELADQERILPTVSIGDLLTCRELKTKDHTTQPPARFSEASLTAALEERGIGRPSTYASIIETILARQYVFKKGNALVPTWTAFSVSRSITRTSRARSRACPARSGPESGVRSPSVTMPRLVSSTWRLKRKDVYERPLA